MPLISKEDLIKASGMNKLGFLKNPAAAALMKAAKINDINILYDKLKNKNTHDFFEDFVRELSIQYVVFEEDIAKIPRTGPFILVSNHPLGAIDGILMCKIISEVRPDFKIMGNFLLEKIAPLKDMVIPVNPFGGERKSLQKCQPQVCRCVGEGAEGG